MGTIKAASHDEAHTFLRASNSAQVVAVDSADGSVVVLADGEAEALKSSGRGPFMCPVPDCPDRRFLVIGGTAKRHHFRHRHASVHPGARETVLHYEGKHVLGRWAAMKLAEADPCAGVAQVEPAFIEHAGGKRRPDVQVTWHGAHQPLVLEVECFNSTTPDTLRDRREHYSAAGYTDQWVFGHTSKHFTTALTGPSGPAVPVWFGPVPHAVAATGDPVLILNPHQSAIGTVVVDEPAPGADQEWWKAPEGVGLRFATTTDRRTRAYLVIDPLDACDLDPVRGLVTPTMRAVWQARKAIMARAAQEAERDKARRAAEAARELERVQRERNLAEQQERHEQRRRELALARAERDAQEWGRHPRRERLVRRFGYVPEHIAVGLDTDSGVLAYPEFWHAVVFEELVARRGVGSKFGVADAYRALRDAEVRLDPSSTRRGRAVGGYFVLPAGDGAPAFHR